MMYLLDTNMCIYLMKNTYPCLAQKILSLNPNDIAISSVTVFELEYGAAKSSRSNQTRTNLRFFLAPFTVIPFDSSDAIIAGEIRSQLEKKGTPIGPYDLPIASQGISKKMIVVTHNTDEFSHVPNINIEDWTVNSI